MGSVGPEFDSQRSHILLKDSGLLCRFSRNEVVSVSHTADPSTRQICRFCGFVIDRELKRCPALDEGVCRP